MCSQMLGHAVYVCLLLFCICQPSDCRCQESDMGSGFATGSVLFHRKKCWQHDDLVLLSTRKTMQNLIPTNKLDTSNDEYVPALMEYFRTCFSKAQEISFDKALITMQLALADAVGGYLHYYAIPITLYGFYAGTVRYEYAQTLFTFFNDLKVHLDTRGDYWSKPIDARQIAPDVRPMYVPAPRDDEDPCALILTGDRLRDTAFSTGHNGIIPLPYLDCNAEPTAIAVPMRSTTQLNLKSPDAANVLEKYYVAGIQCLRVKACSTDVVVNFKHDFKIWLKRAVVPRLRDEQLYPAFGGVLRILGTMKQSNPDGIGRADSYRIAPSRLGIHSVSWDWLAKWPLMVGLVVGAVITWLCGAMLCLCLRRRKHNSYKRLDVIPNDDDTSCQFINTFVQVFYDFKDSCYNCIAARETDSGNKLENKNNSEWQIMEGPSTQLNQRQDCQCPAETIENPGAHPSVHPITSKTQSAPLPSNSSIHPPRTYSVHNVNTQSRNPLRGSNSDVSSTSTSDCQGNCTTTDEEESIHENTCLAMREERN